jgi:prepilin signal peptidase PulO-like enzyme (type II secretory pathway)
MYIFGAIIACVIGAAFGSFANVVVIRLKNGEKFGGRSHCMSCKKTLAPLDLVPIVSWFMLGGKCRYCRKTVHWQYPVVETAMSVFTVIAYFHNTSSNSFDILAMGFEVALAFILVVLTTFDARWKLVPMEFLIGSTILLAAWRLLLGVSWLELVLGAIVISVLLGLLVVGSRGSMMGEGDPFVGLFMGTVLGFPLALLGLLISFVIGGSVAAALLMEGAVGRKTQIAFVPFLAAGTLIAFWWRAPLEVITRYALGI